MLVRRLLAAVVEEGGVTTYTLVFRDTAGLLHHGCCTSHPDDPTLRHVIRQTAGMRRVVIVRGDVCAVVRWKEDR